MNFPTKRPGPKTANRVWKTLVYRVSLRDGIMCKVCKDTNTDNLTIDHIHPQIFGGKDELDNLQILCKKCHVIKDKPICKDPRYIKMLKDKIELPEVDYPHL
jgi:5-methylcytosine-specific restriction endonuclease McrA